MKANIWPWVDHFRAPVLMLSLPVVPMSPGPGFAKDQFKEYLDAEAVRKDVR